MPREASKQTATLQSTLLIKNTMNIKVEHGGGSITLNKVYIFSLLETPFSYLHANMIIFFILRLPVTISVTVFSNLTKVTNCLLILQVK